MHYKSGFGIVSVRYLGLIKRSVDTRDDSMRRISRRLDVKVDSCGSLNYILTMEPAV